MNTNNEWSLRKGNESKVGVSGPWWVIYDRVFSNRRKFYSDSIFKYNPTSVLELGCTGGANIQYFPKEKLNIITAVDINKYALEYAKQTKPGPKYHHHDITSDFNFIDSNVDIVCSMGVLIHIRPDHIDQVLKSMIDVCNVGLVLMETADYDRQLVNGTYPQWIHNIPEKIKNLSKDFKITVTELPADINDEGAQASYIKLIEAIRQ